MSGLFGCFLRGVFFRFFCALFHLARWIPCFSVVGTFRSTFSVFFLHVAVVRVWGPFSLLFLSLLKIVVFFDVFYRCSKPRVFLERCSKNGACGFFSCFLMKNGCRKLRISAVRRSFCNSQGFSQFFLMFFLLGVFFGVLSWEVSQKLIF